MPSPSTATRCSAPRDHGTFPTTYGVFVINLASATARWDAVAGRLAAAGMTGTRIEAVNGRALRLPIPEFDETRHRLCTGRRPILPEIGCYLSHLAAMDAFLATADTHGLILEDDARFDATLPGVVASALEWADAWDILRLSTVGRDRVCRIVPLDGGRHLGVNLTRTKGSAAYMLNRRAAETLRRRLVPMCLAYDIAYDLEYLLGLQALAVSPYPVRQDGEPSQIQSNVARAKLPATRYLSVFPFRAAVETARVVMRCGLAVRTSLAVRRAAHGARRLRLQVP